MSQFTDALSRFFRPLSVAQRVLFGIISIIIVVSVVGTFIWATRPDYSLLFGNLAPSSAQTIVEELQKKGVPYNLTDGGSTIMVPRESVYELRLQFAQQGAKGSDYRGYELFDSNTLGMTDFMQRVNLKRALEGELARTIGSMDQIEFARVHLVLPERSPFTESTVQASASVILNMNPSSRLSPAQIEGISSLVAGSVEELAIENVTILDQRGNKISNNEALGSDIGLSNAQLKVKQQAENYLTVKGQTMLDRVLGTGNSIVRVSTDHDFEKLSRDSELIDPESRIVISEETRTQALSDVQKQPIPFDQNDPPALRGQTVDKGTNQQESSTRVRNYEVNTTREKYEKPIGTISRMTVSVLLNYKQNRLQSTDGRDSVIYFPYTQAELRDITGAIRNALGVNAVRGDDVTITQIRFEDQLSQDLQQQTIMLQEQIQLNQWIKWGFILLGLMAALAILYAIVRKVNPNTPPLFFDMKPEIQKGESGNQKSLPKNKTEQNDEGESDFDEDNMEFVNLESSDVYQRKLSPEAQKRLKMKSKMFDEIKNFAEFKPDEAANLVRSFMVKEKPGK
ncbi:flagellar M-ring protein FliF [bacterium]|nr:MAG: flagellar M-ring protein FliF [bacterium]